MNEIENQLVEIFDDLLRSGVRFFYGDMEIEFGEVTEVLKCESSKLNLVLDDERNVTISVYDFRENHTKENVNLYDWEPYRRLEALMDELS